MSKQVRAVGVDGGS